MDNTKETHIFQSSTGNAEITVHKVFPGIELCYNAVHMDKVSLNDGRKGILIEINHCQEGRMEQQLGDEFFYLMPGDLSITLRSGQMQDYSFPLRHYHGIGIGIDPSVAPQCFSCFLQDVNVQPMQVAKRLCGDGKCFILRSEKYIEHIFSELYTVPESYQKGYMKIKIMELLLVLSDVDPMENGISAVSLSQNRVHLAKSVSSYLHQRMNEKVSVAELADKFRVSQTLCAVMGETPMEYRKLHTLFH